MPGWVILALAPILLLGFAIQAVLFGWQPPHGWGAVLIGIGFFVAYWWVVFRFPLLGVYQYLDIRANALVVRTTWQSRIPFAEIANVQHIELEGRVDLLRTFHGFPRFVIGLLMPYELPSFVRRILIPTWDKTPNILIEFRTPVRLGSVPFRWYRALALTLDGADQFVGRLNAAIAASSHL